MNILYANLADYSNRELGVIANNLLKEKQYLKKQGPNYTIGNMSLKDLKKENTQALSRIKYYLGPEHYKELTDPNSIANRIKETREKLLKTTFVILKYFIIFSVIVSLIAIMILPDNSTLECYMVDGEKVCKDGSEWQIKQNLEESVRNLDLEDFES